MKQVEELVQKLADLEKKIDPSLMFSNVTYSHIDMEIESAIIRRDARWLLTLRTFRDHMTKEMDLENVDFKATKLKPFLYFIKDIPEEVSIITIPKKNTYIKTKTKKPTTEGKAGPPEGKIRSPKEDDHIKYKALTNILKQLPFNIYDECVSQQRSKAFYMKKEQLVKKISETPELKVLFPKGTNIGKLSKEGICKEIFKN